MVGSQTDQLTDRMVSGIRCPSVIACVNELVRGQRLKRG